MDRLTSLLAAQRKILGLHGLELAVNVESELSRRNQLEAYLEDQLAQSHQILALTLTLTLTLIGGPARPEPPAPGAA